MTIKWACLQEEATKESHDSGSNTPSDRNGHKPRNDNIAKQWPVHTLLGANTTNCHNTSDLAMRGTDRNREIRRNQNSEGCRDFNDKTTERRKKKNDVANERKKARLTSMAWSLSDLHQWFESLDGPKPKDQQIYRDRRRKAPRAALQLVPRHCPFYIPPKDQSMDQWHC